MTEKQVVLTLDRCIARVELNRPDKLNAVGQELADALEEAIEQAGRRGARCAVLTGRGRAFCVGADLGGNKGDPAAAEAWILRVAGLLQRVQELPCPLIAYVHGYALGLGASLAMAADLVIAADDTRFGFPEVHHGLIPGVTMALLAERVNLLAANEIILLGEKFDAAAAQAYGLVNKVVAPADADAMIADWTGHLMKASPAALRTSKRLLREMIALTPKSRMAAGVDAVLTGRQSEDAQEGFTAFREKRQPRWTV